MMNSSHTNEAYAASPFMSFVGIEGTGSTQTGLKHQLWDWESTHALPATTHNLPFYTLPSPPSLLDCPTHHQPPSLFSTNSLPFYFQPPPPPMTIHDYSRSFFKLDDGLTGGFGGGGGTPRIGLNLGRRTYFSSGDHHLLLFGRSAHHQPPRCQADGCRADLSGAKHYHRRHKVCDFHSKASVVFVSGGLQQRFCQQCSRFHGLPEFDDTKRSCRKRLAEHNRRRRKPQIEISNKGSGSQSSSTALTTKPKEGSNLSSTAAAGKPINQLSSIIKSSNSIEPSLSIEGQQKKALIQFTSGSALSLGGIGGVIQEHKATVFMSEEERASQYQQQQQQLQCQFSSPCSSSNTYFHHQSLFNEGSHSTEGGPEMTHQHQTSILQLGQSMFEWDFI